LEDRGWIASFWGTSENNRKARYYRLTPKGRKQLVEQTGRWEQMVRAINRVLRPLPAEESSMRLPRFLRRFFRRDDWDQERARELDAYLETEVQENLARGLDP